MDIQKMLDMMQEASRRERSRYHLTIGAALKEMAALDQSMLLIADEGVGVSNPHSYRGYYSDLALEPSPPQNTVGEFWSMLSEANGATFEGYKGGDFTMDENTPLWLSPYGTTGRAIMGWQERDGVIVLQTRYLD